MDLQEHQEAQEHQAQAAVRVPAVQPGVMGLPEHPALQGAMAHPALPAVTDRLDRLAQAGQMVHPVLLE